MHEQFNELKDRIQRKHFLSQARTLCQADPILSLSKITLLIPNCLYPPWKTFNPSFKINEIQGIMKKGTQSKFGKKEHIGKLHSQDIPTYSLVTHIY